MTRVLIVAAGGALGAVARYGVGRLVPASGWPWGTMAVNVVGGLAMGLLTGWLAFRGGAGGETVRLFAAVGVLGGFTTFSAFSLETVRLAEEGQMAAAAANAALNLVLCLAACVLGMALLRRYA